MFTELRSHVRAAAERAAACEAVWDIYKRLQRDVDERKPICISSGRCCHFEEYGHRLYVTTMELAAFVRGLKALPRDTRPPARGEPLEIAKSLKAKILADPYVHHGPEARVTGEGLADRLAVLSEKANEISRPGGCTFQVGKLCGVHTIRPFGCRIFYCDPTATDWQQEQYEKFHAKLKRLHEQFDIPYFYLEWREALAVIAPDAGV